MELTLFFQRQRQQQQFYKIDAIKAIAAGAFIYGGYIARASERLSSRAVGVYRTRGEYLRERLCCSLMQFVYIRITEREREKARKSSSPRRRVHK